MLVSLVEDRSKASGWAGLISLDLHVAAGHELSFVLFYAARELKVGLMWVEYSSKERLLLGMACAGQGYRSTHTVTERVSVLVKEQ